MEKISTFEDLNSYVNACVWELHDYERIFHNQLIASVEQEQQLQINRDKLSYVIARCNCLKQQQSDVDSILEYVISRINQWECLICDFEKRYERDLNVESCDCFRKDMYDKSERIAVGLHNFMEIAEILEGQLMQNEQSNEPIDALFKVIHNCFDLLDKLHVHSLKLTQAVNVTEQMIRRHLCNCNQSK